MNDGKPIDETRAESLADVSTSNKATIRAGSDGPDHRRRRLIRGAVGIAPVVITLRSGSLAASSCVGTKGVGTAAASTGQITLTSPAGTPAAGDHCVYNYDSTGCPTHEIPKILPISQSSASSGGDVDLNGGAHCTLPPTSDTNVAIISFGVTSFM